MTNVKSFAEQTDEHSQCFGISRHHTPLSQQFHPPSCRDNQKETESCGSAQIERLASIIQLLQSDKVVFIENCEQFVHYAVCFIVEFCCNSSMSSTRLSKKF